MAVTSVRVSFRFYATLNDFLPPRRRQARQLHATRGPVSVKDAIEALGVPHAEVDLVLVNGRSVGFAHRLHDGDRVSVYPAFASLDVSAVTRVRPRPLGRVRFVLDVHLGRLAGYLRLAGFDARYRNDWPDAELAAVARRGGRVLLTCDVGLLKRTIVTRGYCLRARVPRQQLVEVLRRFDLARHVRPFTRCLRCNRPVRPVAKRTVLARLPARVRAGHDDFSRCPACGRVYWRGTHYDWMAAILAWAVGEADAAPPRTAGHPDS